MARKQFTFYESFYSAISRIRKKTDRADAYDVICAYALNQVEPDLSGVSDSVAIAFELLRPVLDKAREKSESGKRGGSKPEANRKQTESKPEASGNWKLGETVSEKEREKEVEVEVENEYYNKHSPSPSETTNVSGELPNSPPAAAVLPLIGGDNFLIGQDAADELCTLYPAVDVMQELRNMRGWLLANPRNRKTKTGIMRFVNAWLSREQNRARPSGGNQRQACQKPTKAQELDANYAGETAPTRTGNRRSEAAAAALQKLFAEEQDEKVEVGDDC